MRWSFALLAVLALVAGCSSAATHSGWRELPAPAAGARVLELIPVRDGVLALGSVPSGADRAPAAWLSADGTRWSSIPVRPQSPYGFLAELISAGAGERTVVLGQAFGGAHGNPRMTVWSADHPELVDHPAELVEHPQVFELFGGPHALAVTAAAGLAGVTVLIGGWDGPGGRYGAATWTSVDGATWERHADDPVLSSAPGELTGAAAITTGPPGFVIVGQTQRDRTQLPLEWTSPDGFTWRRISLPGTAALATRAGCNPDRCTIFGQSTSASPTLLCWPNDATPAVPGPAAGIIDTLKVIAEDSRTLAMVRLDGAAHLLSVDPNCADWQDIPLPVPATRVQMAALPAGLLLSTIEDNASRLWLRSQP
ncbi:hypothetical protein [Nocardia sp. NPDC056000]|uniref:hypothetical protein n=1 Tax=Nocardia sp. NPDC056000 TaxID=3345674 RepID=UPI0035E15D7E